MAIQIFDEQHHLFRNSVRRFCENEIAPHTEGWRKQGEVPREIWRKLGEQGFIGFWVEEQYGGADLDFAYSIIMIEELCRVGASGLNSKYTVHNDITMPYINMLGSHEQKLKWLPKCCNGDYILSIGMTEPGAGSDLASLKTTAVRDGDDYVINGQKTFITNGYQCDLIVVACKTDVHADPPYKGVSLIAVEEGTPGFVKNRKLEKMGMHDSDTAEIFFEDCRVPAENLLGKEGEGFKPMMKNLQQERLVACVGAVVTAEHLLEITIDYTKTRTAFGRPISSFQHNTFKIVEMATEIEMAKTFTYSLVEDHLNGENITRKVSMAKWYNSELLNRVAYHCVQLHGGYGYMEEYEIARAYQDVRARSIAAGSTEIMKRIIGKMMDLGQD
jgi:acyl-CoA dehydrogenase